MRTNGKFDSLLMGITLIGACLTLNAEGSPGVSTDGKGMMRVCAAQPMSRLIDWRLKPVEVLAQVDKSLGELGRIVNQAGASGCDALALPEDTLGTLHWEMGNKSLLKEVLPQAVGRMLTILGREAATHHMYLVCSNDTAEPDGSYRNTAFFLGRDGKEIGHYYKVHPAITESDRKRGDRFPVFDTSDLGGVGMLICYDMVMPESSRCLALAGADIIFVVTLGGATTAGDPDAEGGDLDRASFRTRAADNYLYVAVAKRGGGAMIISPQGKVLAEGKGSDGIAIADINPFAGRQAGDAWDSQSDMRARLFRERNPSAYGLLTDPNPLVLKKIPASVTVEEAVRIAEKAMTIGGERFQEAESLLKAGKNDEAIVAFENLRKEFPRTWIDRAAREELAKIHSGGADKIEK
ncbi:MAG TPA: carbon-nitrogen hydrolase family protein [Terriglobia bacterium]|nr:carbon-nitrogen hydrolase family protein [Terriglobia bacterium]